MKVNVKDNGSPHNGELNPGMHNGNAKDHLELPGKDAAALISNRPPFLIRWGISIMLLIAVLLLVVAWFIKYPDIITARGTLNSINAPKKITVKAEGKLIKLFVKEGQQVKKDELVGYVESIADPNEVIQLDVTLDSIYLKVINDQSEKADILGELNYLGELQASYQVFYQAYQHFKNYLSTGFYLKKKNMLRKDLEYMTQLHFQLTQQQHLLTEDFLLTDTTFLAQQSLHNQKIISPMEYRNERSKMLTKKMSLPQIQATIISNKMQQQEKLKEITELENQIQQEKDSYLQAINTIRSQVEEWKKKFLLLAPSPGKVFFASFLQEGQEMKAGQLVCFINPGNSEYYAEVLVSQHNFGKLSMGQSVLLKLPSYPYQEFGFINGRIDFINEVPSDSGYLVKVALPDGLMTSDKKRILYHEGLIVNGEIITKNLRLTDRFFHSLRSMKAGS